MASLEHLDLLIGDALERLIEAADETRGIKEIDKSFLMQIGRIVSEFWSLREDIYKIKPSIKRDFVLEYEKNKERFESLNKLHEEAFKMEINDDRPSAKKLYQQLYDVSHFGYFRLLAEAGLYRTTGNKGGSEGHFPD